MRRSLMALALTLMAGSVAAQSVNGGFIQYQRTGGGGTPDFPLLGATGCTDPPYSFTDDTNAGLCLGAADQLILQTAASGSSRSYINSTNAVMQIYHVGGDGNANGFSLAQDEVRVTVNNQTHTTFSPDGRVTVGSAVAAANTIDLDGTAGSVIFEGATANGFETTIAITDPTADRTITITDIDWTVRCLSAGTGVSIANACGLAGNPTITADTAVVNTYTSGTGSVPANGFIGTFYCETDTNRCYTYPSTDTEHYLLSIAPGSLAQGDVFYIDSAGSVARLGAGTSGHFLQTQGAAANPQWAAAGGGAPFADTTSIVEGSADGTKELRFEVDGFTTGTTRVVTVPNADITMAATNLAQSFSENLTLTTANPAQLVLGSLAIGYIAPRTIFTPDSVSFGPGTTSNSWHFQEQADNFDFNNGPCGTSACTDPTLLFHSHNQSTSQYTGITANVQSHRRAFALTEAGGAEVVFTITTATTQSGGGEVDYKIHATDGTDYAVRAGKIRFVLLNIGGTVTATLSGADETADGSVFIGTAGETLTYAITADVATANTFKLAFNIDSNITVSAAHIDYVVTYNGPGLVVPQ